MMPAGPCIAAANVVIGIHNLQFALGKRARVLNCDQYAIAQSAGGKNAPGKIGGLATTCQPGCNRKGSAGAYPKTSLLQNPLPQSKARNVPRMMAFQGALRPLEF